MMSVPELIWIAALWTIVLPLAIVYVGAFGLVALDAFFLWLRERYGV